MPKGKTPTDSEAAERQKLVNRYVGKEFDDDDHDEGEREVVDIVKEGGDWLAVTVLVVGEGNEQSYLVNESLDEMIDAHKKTQDKDNDSDFERPAEEQEEEEEEEADPEEEPEPELFWGKLRQVGLAVGLSIPVQLLAGLENPAGLILRAVNQLDQ